VDEDEDHDDVPTVSRWLPVAAFVLSLVGVGISLYLTIDHFQGTLPSCPATGFVDCKKVTTSEYSYLFHVPVSLLGLLFYTGMVAINWPPLWRSPIRAIGWVRLAMVVGGVGFVLYLLAAELFSIKAICLWCTGVHIDTFILFVLVVTSFPAMTSHSAGWQEWEYEDDDGDDDHADFTGATTGGDDPDGT
jgi:uncharacterized membrane protein